MSTTTTTTAPVACDACVGARPGHGVGLDPRAGGETHEHLVGAGMGWRVSVSWWENDTKHRDYRANEPVFVEHMVWVRESPEVWEDESELRAFAAALTSAADLFVQARAYWTDERTQPH